MRPLTGIYLALAALLSGCGHSATVRPTPSDLAAPARTSLELTLAGVTAEQAVNRAKAAFVAEGLVVASATGGVVVSEPVRLLTAVSDEIDHQYRATIIDESGGARVVVSGGSRLAGRDGAWNAVRSHDPSFPATVGYHGWLKVRRLAARLAGEQVPESE